MQETQTRRARRRVCRIERCPCVCAVLHPAQDKLLIECLTRLTSLPQPNKPESFPPNHPGSRIRNFLKLIFPQTKKQQDFSPAACAPNSGLARNWFFLGIREPQDRVPWEGKMLCQPRLLSWEENSYKSIPRSRRRCVSASTRELPATPGQMEGWSMCFASPNYQHSLWQVTIVLSRA